jgi:hypothetical protein
VKFRGRFVLATLEAKVPDTPPDAVRIVYCLEIKLPLANAALTVAPPSVAVPLTLVDAAAVGVTCTR